MFSFKIAKTCLLLILYNLHENRTKLKIVADEILSKLSLKYCTKLLSFFLVAI